MQRFPRRSGVLMPVSSLPGKYGIGTLGEESRKFVDFLWESHQSYWQVLPIGPTGFGDSPYQSFSTFAINPYFIDLEQLKAEGYLTAKELEKSRLDEGDAENVDYGKQFSVRLPLLKKAAHRFLKNGEHQAEYREFLEENQFWLPEYALFMALKEVHGGAAFTSWEEPLQVRQPEVLFEEKLACRQETEQWQVLQFWARQQWNSLHEYALSKGIKIIGDIPIYVSPDSSDLWTHPELFQTTGSVKIRAVAGCPPDAFSADGQLWGNPLYDWDYHRATGYAWWIERLKYMNSLFDVVRIDHFRGFAGYYSIEAGAKTAAGGHWEQGPGSDFIFAIKQALPEMKIIAEDLGYLTDDVRQMLRDSEFPGMKVLQFAFDSREESDYLPHNYPNHCVVYTGTHDNTTTADWKISAPPQDSLFAQEYLDTDPDNFTRKFVRAALASVADTAIIPMQDWLELGKETRINTPSTTGSNWKWRMKPDAISNTLPKEIARITDIYGRKG